MKEFTISVNIGDRAYRLKSGPGDEEFIRKAAKEINEQIKEYSQHYAFNDKQDLLAMTALHFALSSSKSRADNAKMLKLLDQKIGDMESVVNEHLD